LPYAFILLLSGPVGLRNYQASLTPPNNKIAIHYFVWRNKYKSPTWPMMAAPGTSTGTEMESVILIQVTLILLKGGALTFKIEDFTPPET
jgi:hypothetical protein